MSYDSGYSNKRNKGKDKRREKKKHPYKSGGKFRSTDIKISSSSDSCSKDEKKGK